jgi:hypothetical protein
MSSATGSRFHTLIVARRHPTPATDGSASAAEIGDKDEIPACLISNARQLWASGAEKYPFHFFGNSGHLGPLRRVRLPPFCRSLDASNARSFVDHLSPLKIPFR